MITRLFFPRWTLRTVARGLVDSNRNTARRGISLSVVSAVEISVQAHGEAIRGEREKTELTPVHECARVMATGKETLARMMEKPLGERW
jgi:hypothetical protein